MKKMNLIKPVRGEFEYHGCTTAERIHKKGINVIAGNRLLFNTIKK